MTRCDYAACSRPAVHSDQGFGFCRGHYTEHLAELREQASRSCSRCGVGFVSTNPRTHRCRDCRRVDSRNPYARRVS